MARMKRLIPALLALVAMAGCDSLPVAQPSPGGPSDVREFPAVTPSPTEDLLAVLDLLAGASPAELAREYDALAAVPEPNRSTGSLLRLALLQAQPGLPFRDDASALRSLQEWERRQAADGPAEPRAFVRWLKASLAERLRLAGAVDESVTRLRDERRRAEQYREKLEAIRAMEKSLIERDKR